MSVARSGRGSFTVGSVSSARVCAFAILLAYAAVWFAVPSEGRWIYDTALKTIQVRAIVEQGALALDWPGRELDPALHFFPLARGFYTQVETQVGTQVETEVEGELHSAYSPVFPLLSAPFVWAFGEAGYGVLPLLGAWLVAIGVARLARRVALDASSFAPLASALALLTTPLFFYSFTFWEHTLAAGLGCFAVEACLVFRERLDLASAGRLGLWLALPIYLRPEHYLFALVVLGFAAWPARRDLRVVAWMGLALVATLLPLWGFHLALFGHPLGPHIASQPWGDAGVAQYVAERGAVVSRLLFNFHGNTALSLGVGIPCYALLVARLTGRLTPKHAWLAACWGIVAAAVVAHGFATTARPMNWLIAANGLFAGSPLLLLAFASERGDEASSIASARRAVLGIAVVHAAIYAAFIPEVNSRGIHWGNRFLLSVVPLLAVLCAVSLRGMWQGASRFAPRRVVASALVVTTLALQLYSLAMLRERKLYTAALNEAVRRSEVEVVASDTWFVPVDLAGTFFEKSIFLAPAKRRAAFERQLRAAGVERVLYVDRARPQEGGPGVDDGWLGFSSVRLREVMLGAATSRRTR